MATLYITEYSFLTPNAASVPLLHTTTIIAEQHVEFTDESVQSKPFNDKTGFIVINCDDPCSLAFGKDPKATTEAHRMSANETRGPMGVLPGDRVAVIANF